MPKFMVRVHQTFRVERYIDREVEAKDVHEAVDITEPEEAPPEDDPRWQETKELINEWVVAL